MTNIAELETWFRTAKLPAAPIQLFPGTTIMDVETFLQSHFTPLKLSPSSPTAHTHLYRLLALKSYIESQDEKI